MQCIGNVETYKIRIALFFIIILIVAALIVIVVVIVEAVIDVDIDIDIAVQRIAAPEVLFSLAAIQYVLQESISDSSRIKQIDGK